MSKAGRWLANQKNTYAARMGWHSMTKLRGKFPQYLKRNEKFSPTEIMLMLWCVCMYVHVYTGPLWVQSTHTLSLCTICTLHFFRGLTYGGWGGGAWNHWKLFCFPCPQVNFIKFQSWGSVQSPGAWTVLLQWWGAEKLLFYFPHQAPKLMMQFAHPEKSIWHSVHGQMRS